MLTRLIRLSLAAELAAYVVLGALLRECAQIALVAIVLAAVGVALSLRFGLVCFTALHGWAFGSPRADTQRLGVAGIARYLWTEYRALLTDNFAYLPFESLALRPDPVPVPSRERVIVVLLHGYLSNRGYFRPMVRWLEAKGVSPIFVPDYRSVFGTIEESTRQFAAHLERVLPPGQGRAVLVCHSMGGLLARQYLREHGEERIARLVTIASPHHGTVLSRYGIGGHARQMRRGSEFLRALAQAEAARVPRVPTTSIFSVHDNLVAPQDTSRLDWARNIAVAGVGHVAIIDCEPVFELVLGELRAAGV